MTNSTLVKTYRDGPHKFEIYLARKPVDDEHQLLEFNCEIYTYRDGSWVGADPSRLGIEKIGQAVRELQQEGLIGGSVELAP